MCTNSIATKLACSLSIDSQLASDDDSDKMQAVSHGNHDLSFGISLVSRFFYCKARTATGLYMRLCYPS